MPDVVATHLSHGSEQNRRIHATPVLPLTGEGHEEVLDLVCHTAIPMGPSAFGSHWGEDEFYFCSVFCQRRFVQNPSAYVPQRDLIDQPQHRDSDHAAA